MYIYKFICTSTISHAFIKSTLHNLRYTNTVLDRRVNLFQCSTLIRFFFFCFASEMFKSKKNGRDYRKLSCKKQCMLSGQTLYRRDIMVRK